MFKFRPQRGSLDDAMKEVVEVNSLAELVEHLNTTLGPFLSGRILPEDLECKYYTYDERIDWDTYIWRLKDFGVVGYTNSSLGVTA